MKLPYKMSLAAEADLREIIRHTVRQWGTDQARTYANSLRKCAEVLAKDDALFLYKDLSALYPGLRMARCEHHYIFCLMRPGASALVVAILHEKMDLIRRVSQRLQY